MTDFADRFVTQPDPLDAFDRVTASIGALIDRVERDQLDDPTPCRDWTVRRLLQHLAFVNDRYATVAEAGVSPDHDPDYEDPAGAFSLQTVRASAAFRRPGYLDEVSPTPIGPQPGSVTVQHVLNELVVHGWDLATALHTDTDLVPDVAEHSLASWRVFLDGSPRPADLAIGPEQPAPPGANATDLVAAYLGRTVTSTDAGQPPAPVSR